MSTRVAMTDNAFEWELRSVDCRGDNVRFAETLRSELDSPQLRSHDCVNLVKQSEVEVDGFRAATKSKFP